MSILQQSVFYFL